MSEAMRQALQTISGLMQGQRGAVAASISAMCDEALAASPPPDAITAAKREAWNEAIGAAALRNDEAAKSSEKSAASFDAMPARDRRDDEDYHRMAASCRIQRDQFTRAAERIRSIPNPYDEA